MVFMTGFQGAQACGVRVAARPYERVEAVDRPQERERHERGVHVVL